MGKIYRGSIIGDEREVTVDDRPLRHRFDLRNHSPTGYAWGYGGSGPAQLAVAILAEHFRDVPGGDELATRYYQVFKTAVVAQFLIDRKWHLTEENITVILKKLGCV